jgi:hypothetical protein
MQMTRWCYGLGIALAVCFLGGGCSDSKAEKTSQVSGKVELDGKPLPDGSIMFVGDPGTVPDSLPIKDGDFSGKVKVGKKKVAIQAYKTEPPPPGATGDVKEVKVNYLPDRYSVANSTITAEVTDGGVNPNKFEVKSE